MTLSHWLLAQRFFGGSADDAAALRIVSRRRFNTAEQVIVDAGARYQLWLPHGWEQRLQAQPAPSPRSELTDALLDTTLAPQLLRELAPLFGLPAPANIRPFSGEQTNTSLICDGTSHDDPGNSTIPAIWKFFRQLAPGTNPDVELVGAITAAANSTANKSDSATPPPVPRLLGHWTDTTACTAEFTSEAVTFAMAQELVAGARDGWNLALAWTEDELANQAASIGHALASTHLLLAEALPTSCLPAAAVVAGFRQRLSWAAGIVPELAALTPRIAARFDALADLGPIPVQRIHGDLHLGQLLFDGTKWLLIDFEGDPARPWAERRLPDSPLRDVAGMLRSFSYAAATKSGVGSSISNLASADRFLTGYLDCLDAGVGLTGGTKKSSTTDAEAAREALLRGYVLDKAVYECAYEARHRPEWLPLPLAAIKTLLGA